MFKIRDAPGLIAKIHALGFSKNNSRWLYAGYWLVIDPIDKSSGFIHDKSANSYAFVELKKVNQEIITQLELLHSIGLIPQEIGEIINE